MTGPSVVVSTTVILRPGFEPKQTVVTGTSPTGVLHLGMGATIGTRDPKHLRALALVALQAADALDDALDSAFLKEV